MGLTSTTQDPRTHPGEHAVQFYTRDEDLCRSVGTYLSNALLAGGVAIAVATPAHRRGIERELEAAGIDVASALAGQRLLYHDAAQALAGFCSEGKIDRQAFDRTIGQAVREAGDRGRPVGIYGEMVALLWDAGDVLSALELEELWNDLGEQIRFSLLCGYPRAAVATPEHREALQRVCQLHSHVQDIPGPGVTHHGDPETIEVAAQFPPQAEAPRAARRLLTGALEQAGVTDAVFCEDANLLLSELVTNAVLHADSPVSVVVRCEPGAIRVSVHDSSSEQPTLRARGLRSGLGMGLQLVAWIASDWGVEPGAEGKTVWAELRP